MMNAALQYKLEIAKDEIEHVLAGNMDNPDALGTLIINLQLAAKVANKHRMAIEPRAFTLCQEG
jgi:hypothetical protein